MTTNTLPKMLIPVHYLTGHSPRQLAVDLHFMRLCRNEPIADCAAKLGVSLKQIEDLKCGWLPTVDLKLAFRMAELYGEQLFIAGGDDYV